jgi:hypothetical protein
MRAPVVQQWTWTLETKDEAVAVTLNEATRKLLDGRNFATVATLNPGGAPHTSVVWVAREGDTVLFSVTSRRQKARNLARDGMDKGESLRAVLGLGNGPPTWTAEQPESMPLAELASRLPQVEFNPEMIHRVMDLGLVELSNDGSEVVVRSPSFLRIGGELAALGVPPDVILDEYEKLRTEAARGRRDVPSPCTPGSRRALPPG